MAVQLTGPQRIQEIKEVMNEELNKHKEYGNKCLSDVKERTNVWLADLVKMIQDLEIEFSKEMEIMMGTQVEMKMELKSSVTQVANCRQKKQSEQQTQNNLTWPMSQKPVFLHSSSLITL